MSWDNVSGIKNIKIWTDYSDVTQGHLFVNDNHQLTLNVGLAFNLHDADSEGPTEDEVYNALSLIDNLDSGPLKYLTIVEANRYSAIYDPNHNQAVTDDDTDTVDDGIYDYQFSYLVASPTSVNAACYSEGVALKLAYSVTDSSGNTSQKVIETSASGTGSSVKTYVAVVCYPAKLYGNKGEHRTNINYSTQDVQEGDSKDSDNGHWNHSDDAFKIIWFYIDDPYFKLFYFDGCIEPDDSVLQNPFYIYLDNGSNKPEWSRIYNTFFPNVKCGEMDFYTTIAVRPDLNPDHKIAVTERINVHQKENQITFIAAHTAVQGVDYSTDVDNHVYIRAYDQFGNSTYIVAFSNGYDAFPQSVS